MVEELNSWLKAVVLSLIGFGLLFAVVAFANAVSIFTQIPLDGILALVGMLITARLIIYAIDHS